MSNKICKECNKPTVVKVKIEVNESFEGEHKNIGEMCISCDTIKLLYWIKPNGYWSPL